MATKENKNILTKTINTELNSINKENINIKLLSNAIKVFLNHIELENTTSDQIEMSNEEMKEFISEYAKGNIDIMQSDNLKKLMYIINIVLSNQVVTKITSLDKEIKTSINTNNKYLETHDSFNDRLISKYIQDNQKYLNILNELSMNLITLFEMFIELSNKLYVENNQTTPNDNTTPGEVVNKP